MATKKRATRTTKKAPPKKAQKKAQTKAAPTKAKTAKAKTATQKTKPTTVSVSAFIASAPENRRADAATLVKMMERVTGERARMWGSSIIGFGDVHYKYASGHEGDAPVVAFAPRKPALVLYLWGDVFAHPLMASLGKCKTGKGCLYVKELADVDQAVLEKLVKASIDKVLARHQT